MTPLAIPTGKNFSIIGHCVPGKPSCRRTSMARIPPTSAIIMARVRYCFPIIL